MSIEWESHLESYVPESGRTAICVGANQGQWVTRLAGTFQKVIAIEPNPMNIKTLRDMNLPNVLVIGAAAWITNGHKLKFHIRDWTSMGGAVPCRDILRDEGVSRTIDVSAISIDSLEIADLDFLIVDTEGAELDVMRGATRTIERCNPDLIIECHERVNRTWLAEWLECCGYNLAHIHDRHRMVGTDWFRFVHLVGIYYRAKTVEVQSEVVTTKAGALFG